LKEPESAALPLRPALLDRQPKRQATRGRRKAVYPLPHDGQRDFVDISTIPVKAIEHVEVLKDSASAVYGSEALAGVVNVNLKQRHSGSMLGMEGGLSGKRGAAAPSGTGIRGLGDSAPGSRGGYVAASIRQQQPILLRRRPGVTGSDWTACGGDVTWAWCPTANCRRRPRRAIAASRASWAPN
jgi:iron complex outermembrane receptor protein